LLTFILIPFILAMFLAINMGGSGTAPAFAAAYGANLIKKHQIALLFGLMVLLGAVFSGKEVSITLGQGILSQQHFTMQVTSVILGAVGLSLLVANLLGIPQSTSQTTVMAIAGAAVALDNLNVQKLFFEIIPTWFILPLVGFFIVWLAGKLLIPYLSRTDAAKNFRDAGQNSVFGFFVLASCLYVSYSIGANNVGNAAGPVTSMAVQEMGVDPKSSNFTVLMILSVLVVAPCFAFGSEMLGYRGLRNTGKEIVPISPLAGMMISLVTATLLLFASVVKGVPTSLVQLNALAFMAHSVNKSGWRSTFTNPQVKRFFLMWAIAPIFAFVVTFLAMFLLK
jgi:sulfate permease